PRRRRRAPASSDMTATLEDVVAKLTQRVPSIQKAAKPEDEVKPYATYMVAAKDVPAAAAWLRDEGGFKLLDMISAVDWKGPTSAEGYIEEPNPNPYVPAGAYS